MSLGLSFACNTSPYVKNRAGAGCWVAVLSASEVRIMGPFVNNPPPIPGFPTLHVMHTTICKSECFSKVQTDSNKWDWESQRKEPFSFTSRDAN